MPAKVEMIFRKACYLVEAMTPEEREIPGAPFRAEVNMRLRELVRAVEAMEPRSSCKQEFGDK
jgi:hypothetical protein